MGTAHDTVLRIRQNVAALGRGSWVLAVSGGMDSMVLLDAAAETLDHKSLTVATFDHRTGSAARAAANLVARRSLDLGIGCVSGAADAVGRSESDWRAARWGFLKDVALRLGATVVTAHSLDDQIETVLIRALRGAGPRGLAGLFAESSVARPLLGTSRAEIAAYADSEDIRHVTDPSNSDRRHLRNRVRLDILPGLERKSPGFASSMLKIAEKAALWRAQMEGIALSFPMMSDSPQNHSFQRRPLRDFSVDSLRCLWPALCARAGIVLDWRGTERLAAFTIEGETGQQIQLSGGVRVHMERQTIDFRPAVSHG
ncbi:MAG: tRNA lysidine(34) synthetase TilS [Gemmatimonadaceae bacterium]